ncbi:MAG TPA: sensor histidine kinase, partial [Anaeromyxobacteraceae bacterium]
MKFRNQLLLALALAGVAPVLLFGALSYRLSRSELEGSVGRAQARAAEKLAADVERGILDSVQHLALAAEYLPFAQLSPREAGAALEIPGRQLPQLEALALLDGSGRAVAPPVVRARAPLAPDGEDPLSAFARAIPVAQALSAGRAVGPPYRDAGGTPRVAVAVRVEGRPQRILAAEVSLAAETRRLSEEAADGDRAVLLDGLGEPVAGAAGGLSADERDLIRGARNATAASVGAVRRGDGEWLAAYAPTSALGWGILVARPSSAAFRAAERVKGYTVFWAAAALVLAGLLCPLLARGIARPVADLSESARALSEGRYDRAADEQARGELGDLARAFNRMAGEVRRRDEEIRAWNAELRSRVDARTAELKAAQDQVARTRRLAALGSLGAGVAHALNNPLTSIVGLVSLARRQVDPASEPGQLLAESLAEAQRAAGVVRQLRALTEEERGAGGDRFPLEKPVLAALDAHRAALRERRVELRVEVGRDLPPVQGDAGQIEQLVGHLVDNAAAAMPGGGAGQPPAPSNSARSAMAPSSPSRIAARSRGPPRPKVRRDSARSMSGTRASCPR